MKFHFRTVLIILLVVATIASQGVVGIGDINELLDAQMGLSNGTNIIQEGNFALETCEDRVDRIRDRYGGAKSEEKKCVNGFCVDGIGENAAIYILGLNPGPIINGKCHRGMCKGYDRHESYEDNMWVIGQLYPRIFINHPEYWPADMTEPDPLGCYTQHNLVVEVPPVVRTVVVEVPPVAATPVVRTVVVEVPPVAATPVRTVVVEKPLRIDTEVGQEVPAWFLAFVLLIVLLMFLSLVDALKFKLLLKSGQMETKYKSIRNETKRGKPKRNIMEWITKSGREKRRIERGKKKNQMDRQERMREEKEKVETLKDDNLETKENWDLKKQQLEISSETLEARKKIYNAEVEIKTIELRNKSIDLDQARKEGGEKGLKDIERSKAVREARNARKEAQEDYDGAVKVKEALENARGIDRKTGVVEVGEDSTNIMAETMLGEAQKGAELATRMADIQEDIAKFQGLKADAIERGEQLEEKIKSDQGRERKRREKEAKELAEEQKEIDRKLNSKYEQLELIAEMEQFRQELLETEEEN